MKHYLIEFLFKFLLPIAGVALLVPLAPDWLPGVMLVLVIVFGPAALIFWYLKPKKYD